MASLQDIAKACGVSIATVSYVVNNGPRPVRAETRARIQKMIDEVGYHPNAHARGLKGMRTDTIGVVFPHVTVPFENSYFGPALEGIMRVTTERHLATMLFTGLSWEEAEMSAPKLCDGRCDGFVLLAPKRKSRLVEELVARKAPMVVVGTDGAYAGVSTVDTDNVEGGRLATKHLIHLGHRRIGVYGFNCHTTSYAERIEGYRQAMAEANLPVTEDLICYFDCPEDIDGEACTREYLSRRDLPTGIFCLQDGAARTVLEVAREFGIRVPQDLSVVGFDDAAFCASCKPPLTTIRQHTRSIGERAAQILCNIVDAPQSKPTRFLSEVTLIGRSSTAPPCGTGQPALSFATLPNVGIVSMEI